MSDFTAMPNILPLEASTPEEISTDTIYDLLSISLFYENKLEESLKYLNIILENEPHNKRIIDNKKIIENMLKSTKKQQKKEL